MRPEIVSGNGGWENPREFLYITGDNNKPLMIDILLDGISQSKEGIYKASVAA